MCHAHDFARCCYWAFTAILSGGSWPLIVVVRVDGSQDTCTYIKKYMVALTWLLIVGMDVIASRDAYIHIKRVGFPLVVVGPHGECGTYKKQKVIFRFLRTYLKNISSDLNRQGK